MQVSALLWPMVHLAFFLLSASLECTFVLHTLCLILKGHL
jgi:hypothetical protein